VPAPPTEILDAGDGLGTSACWLALVIIGLYALGMLRAGAIRGRIVGERARAKHRRAAPSCASLDLISLRGGLTFPLPEAP
jgi:hypothetical protein